MASENVAIHTGYWGCGAYGGNRELMALLQMLTAEFADIQQLVFHIGDQSGYDPFRDAMATFNSLRSRTHLQGNE